ncbi:MAG: ribonuclease HI family protein [Patescibacteria group bacterium]
MKFIVHTDGGARGNPGPAAVGVVIKMLNDKCQMPNEKQKTIEISKRIGETTNNVAEYSAVLEALRNLKSQITMTNEMAKEKNIIHFCLDSNLVVQQLNGVFKVKDPNLRKLFFDVRMLEHEVGGAVTYTYVPREQNRRADYLVNQALDGAPHVSLL